MGNILLRKMLPKDVLKIELILETEFDNFWSASLLKQETKNPSSYYWVAIDKEEIVGFGGILLILDEAHITNIVTKKSLRRKGIASALLEKLIEEAKNLKAISLTLEVNEKNIPAQSLYQKYHFQEIGRRKRYYYAKEDALIMTLYFN